MLFSITCVDRAANRRHDRKNKCARHRYIEIFTDTEHRTGQHQHQHSTSRNFGMASVKAAADGGGGGGGGDCRCKSAASGDATVAALAEAAALLNIGGGDDEGGHAQDFRCHQEQDRSSHASLSGTTHGRNDNVTCGFFEVTIGQSDEMIFGTSECGASFVEFGASFGD